jgi:hypothetical protein
VTVVGVILALVGVVMLAIAVTWAHDEFRLLHEGAHATGTVSAIERSRGSYFPIFRFRDARHGVIEVRSTSSSRRYSRGDSVPVIYDRASPLRAQIDEGVGNYLGAGLVGGMGVLFSAIGTLVCVFRKRFDQNGEIVFSRD